VLVVVARTRGGVVRRWGENVPPGRCRGAGKGHVGERQGQRGSGVVAVVAQRVVPEESVTEELA
jgi:hypothetical protein